MSNLTSAEKETHWEKAAKTRMGKYLTRLETAFILNSIDTQRTHLVLDVGAEAGRFSFVAAKMKADVIGIDLDSYSLKRLKQKNRDISLIRADARKIPLRNSTFDAIFMIEVLDYIPELDEAFAECHRALKEDSPLIVSFGNQSSFKSKLKGFRGKSYLHSYGKVMRCLFEVGLTIKKKTGYNWLPFGRMSGSALIPFSAGMERLFGLRRVPKLSPWVIVSATKSS